MKENKGNFIKLDRSLLNWEWYHKTNTFRLWIHCLLKANWKDGKFEGKVIPRGSFVTSLQKLSDELGISIQQVRTSISHLKSTDNITDKSCSKNRIITVLNYDTFQKDNRQDNKETTDNQQASNKQVTTIEEKKELKNSKNNTFKEKNTKKEKFKKPTLEELQHYCLEKQLTIDCEYFIDYYNSNDWHVGRNKMKDWKATARNWNRKNGGYNARTTTKTKSFAELARENE